MQAYVLFATVRASYSTFWARLRASLIACLSRSCYTHVMIGFADTVLDPSSKGCFFYDLESTIEFYPALGAVFRIPFTYPIDLNYFRHLEGKPLATWPTIRRWLQIEFGFNHGGTDDCICVVLACLRAGGLDVPMRIVSPVELFRWLRNRKFVYATDRFSGFRIHARQLLTS